MKIVKLTIDEESDLEGIDAVALVEEPAIELDFQAFTKYKFESFDDYPKAAKQAAIVGIQRNKDLGNKCGTQVGKVRAQQLAQGKPVTLDTIKRMRSFLLRQRDNYDLAIKRKDYDACGYISYLLWGGPAALPWAEKKLRQAGMLESSNMEIITDEMSKFVDSAGGFSVGDYVSFGFAGKTKDKSRSRGQIIDIKVGGTVKIPGSSFEFKPTKERPLALIKLSSGKTVGQYTDGLRKIQKPDNFADLKDIDGIPVFQDPDLALELAKEIGCTGVHKHEVEGATYYMPCERHSEATDLMLKNKEKLNYFDDMDSDTQELLLKALDKVGISEDKMYEDGWEEITEDNFHRQMYFAIGSLEKYSDPDKRSALDTPNYRILYQYAGPQDSKNREFCSKLIGLTKTRKLLFRVEDINNMSLQGANNEFSTYDIFRYKGSYNCRHSWVQKFYRENKPVDEQKRSTTTNTGPKQVTGGPRTQEASQTNPKSRTKQEVLAGTPAGEFEFSAVQDKMLLAGPLMVADKLIPRIDENGDKYYVFFDEEGIQKLSYKLMKTKLLDSINIEHDPDRKVSDISLVESWLVADSNKDKSSIYGYNLPVGSWFGVYKVNNKRIWDDYIKTGQVKGFSVEGLFNDKIIMQNAIT